MNYFPLGATLLIKAPKIAEKTEGGILKSDAMIKEERMSWDGTVDVIAAGPDCRHISAGMKVLLQTSAIMHPVLIEGQELLQVEEYSVLGYYL
jgi:co-chaperonin GroES (HSP10)